MRLVLLALTSATLAALCPPLHAQTGDSAYFQQAVDFDIDVELDPATHSLAATGNFLYHNRSPRALDSLPVHLWANAYARRDDSPLARQKRRMGDVALHFAPADDLGGYEDLRFTGATLAATRYATPELAWLTLTEPVAAGDSVRVDFAYRLRVPKTFSRMGRDTSTGYQITQWYPKPARYTPSGWHTMPYLDLGEYDNDFGDYDVRVRVPDNGLVAATGQLVNPAGIALREARISASAGADTTSSDRATYDTTGPTRTFRFVARDVHDFAWFASARWRIAVDSAQLTSGATIPAYAYYSAAEAPKWDTAATLVARAARFGDSLVGPYVHPQISAVSAPLGVGGGMEYPMITAIGRVGNVKSLDIVLAHEAFHNWFQGMLASDERRHPWMDEGLTTYLEQRYTEHYYPPDEETNPALPRFIAGGSPYSVGSVLHRLLATARRHPAPATHSDSLSDVGYGYAAYTQPGELLAMLESYLGRDAFERRVRRYYDAWALRHPGPADLQRALGGDEVDWLFDDLLFDNALPDYRIEDISVEGGTARLTVRNVGTVASPFPVALQYADGDYGPTRWIDGFAGERAIDVELTSSARRVAIDPLAETPEVRRADNYVRVDGPTPKLEPLAVNLGTHVGHPDRFDLNVVPVVGFNAADRWLFGVGFHNYTLAPPPTRFFVAPQVATRDASLNGAASLAHSWYRDDAWWREIELSARGRQYHYHYDDTYDYNERFHRGTLGVEVGLAAKPGLPTDRRLFARAHFVALRYVRGINAATRNFAQERDRYAVVEGGFSLDRDDPLRPYGLRLLAQGGRGFSRVSATLTGGLRYNAGGKFVRARLYAGALPSLAGRNDDGGGGVGERARPRPASVELLPNGVAGFFENQYDFTFEQFIVDRSSASSSNQVFVRDGSLTLPFLLPVPSSDTWLASLSVTADAPFAVPLIDLRAYVDAAVYPDDRPDAGGVVVPVTGGLRVSLLGDVVSVSFPLVNSAFVREALPFNVAEPRYRDRIAFSIDLSGVRPDELLREFRG